MKKAFLILSVLLTQNIFSHHIEERFSISDTIYKASDVEILPEYPGGLKSMYNFIAANFKYLGSRNKCYVSFVVNSDGSISNVKAARDNADMGKEAVRVINLMPKWKPGEIKGKKVRVEFLLPIHINK